MSDSEPVVAPPLADPVPFQERPRLLREFMKSLPDDPSAFISVEIRSRSEKVWKALFDVHCEASHTDKATFEFLGNQSWAYAQDAIALVDASLQQLGWNTSGSWRVRMEPAPETTPEPPPGVVVPIAPTAASDRKDLALERISRVNPHLARMATEVQELMLWDQYANSAMNALIKAYAEARWGDGAAFGPAKPGEDVYSVVAREACKYADAMMEVRLARAKRPLAEAVPIPVSAPGPEKEGGGA